MSSTHLKAASCSHGSLLALRSRTMGVIGRSLQRADESLPMTPDIAGRTVVLVNPPSDYFAVYLSLRRAAFDEPRPRFRWLATATGTIEVTLVRLDDHTLDVTPTPAFGFMPFLTEHMLHSSAHPFTVGQRIILDGMTVEIRAVSDDGRPATARFHFDKPLDDPSLYWARWATDHYEPVALPPLHTALVVSAK